MNLQEIKKTEEEMVSKLLNDCCVFFAFSNEQFQTNKTPLEEGEKYVSIGAGGYLPKSKLQLFNESFSNITKWKKNEIKNNKLRKDHILYELNNHEAFYTGELEDTLDALGSDYTLEEVRDVYKKNVKKYWDSQK